MKPKLLDKVRRQILIWSALRDERYAHCGFGLSELELCLGENRGQIQRCLSLLAHEGIMFGRNHPEVVRFSFEHCETDKRFRIRISKEESIRLLEEAGVKYKPTEVFII